MSRVPVRLSLVWAAAVGVTTSENTHWAHGAVRISDQERLELVHARHELGTCSVAVRPMFGAIPVILYCKVVHLQWRWRP